MHSGLGGRGVGNQPGTTARSGGIQPGVTLRSGGTQPGVATRSTGTQSHVALRSSGMKVYHKDHHRFVHKRFLVSRSYADSCYQWRRIETLDGWRLRYVNLCYPNYSQYYY